MTPRPDESGARWDGLPPRRVAIWAALREVREDLGVLVDLIEAHALDEWEEFEEQLLEEWEEIEAAAEEAAVHARRVLLVVAGATLLVVGAAFVFTPIPGTPVILAGLALLATEFAWARRWQLRIEKTTAAALRRLRERVRGDERMPPDALAHD